MRTFCTLAIAAVAALVATAPAAADTAGDLTGARCDPLDQAACLLPWPNDYFTVADPGTPTGRRVQLDLGAMPRNAAGKPIDPAPYNAADGFSPGQLIVTHVPGLDNQAAFEKTGAVPVTDMTRYADPDQPVVVLNADTLERQPIWSEIDATASSPSGANLLIRPAVNFTEGGHYIVALRDLKDSGGHPLEAGSAFRAYRDRQPAADPARRDHMEWIFKRLARAGIKRKDLYLAWDFTVASEKSIAGRMLHIRNDAFAELGDSNLADMKVEGKAPSFVVTKQTDFTEAENPKIARQVEGEVVVPCYLDAPGCPPGSRFAFAPGSDTPLRTPGNTSLAKFTCIIPRAVASSGPGRASLYGHGLFGSENEVTAGNVESMANEHDFVFCATPWTGMSQQDLPNTFATLADLSNFPSLPDRLQQGFLDFMYLGRAMIHPDGFNSNRAFQVGGKGAIDTDRLYYDGNSQGGIAGGGLTAVEPDLNRSVLGVPAMNYSTLLTRSADFDPFAQVLYPAYPNEVERPLIMSLMQMLWDRGEANGYAEHMTSDPLPGTPAHTVLMHVAFGDHQVATVAAEVEARTIGAYAYRPALDPGRSPDATPLWGIPTIPSYPWGGSAIVYWDIGPIRTEGGATKGTDPPPTTNTPPRAGNDPHEAPRSEASARQQKSEFLKPDGAVVNVCGDHPCYAWGWTGP
jgi:hypothetical protein